MPRFPGRALFAVLAVALVAAGLAGCSDDDNGPNGPPPIYSSIVIVGASDTVGIGGSTSFTATVLDTAGQPVATPQITWVSSGTAIATVNNAGVALGVSEGEVIVTAVGGGVTSNGLPLTVFPGNGWLNQTSNAFTIRNLHGVHFIDSRTGWAVGDAGTIIKTIDAGKTWLSQTSNSTGYTLNAVAFTSPTEGIVVGSAGRVLRTVNGGTTWAQLTIDSDGGKGINDVYFQDPLRGWMVGNGGLVLRTTNGGASWTRVLPSVTAANLESVSFPRYGGVGTPPDDPYGFGWAVGDGGTILASDDFGQDWRIYLPFETADGLTGVARRGKVDGIAVGLNNRALYTTASADSAQWNLHPGTTPFTNFESVWWSVQSAAPGSAWAAGKRPDTAIPVVLYSIDGGVTWLDQLLPSTAPLTGNGIDDIFFLDDTHGWAVGSQGLILHTVTGGN